MPDLLRSHRRARPGGRMTDRLEAPKAALPRASVRHCVRRRRRRTRCRAEAVRKNRSPASTIPIDQPSRAIAVLENPAACQFLAKWGKTTAERLEVAAITGVKDYQKWSAEQKAEYWRELEPTVIDASWAKNLSADDKDALKFVAQQHIALSDLPAENVCQGPLVSEHKGTASLSLQQLGQQLNATNPGPPPGK